MSTKRCKCCKCNGHGFFWLREHGMPAVTQVYCDCAAASELKTKDDSEPVVIDPYRRLR